MTIRELLQDVPVRSGLSADIAELATAGLDYDSRRIQPGQLFFAFTGTKVDGQSFARQAIEKGAVAVVSESPRPADFPAPWLEVEHGRRAMARAASAFYGHPEERIAITGVTGTNGKTTTTYLINALLRSLGRVTGLIGTVEYELAGRKLPAVNTTPDSLEIYRLLHELERAGGTHLTMEVSSHALSLGRVHGLSFHTAVFTNLTRDHLDFHRTMEDYFTAKRLLFAGLVAPTPRVSVVNADDPYGEAMVKGVDTTVVSYGLQEGASLRAVNVESGFGGLRFDVEQGGRRTPVRSPLVGKINAYNLLAAFGVGLSYGFEPEQVAEGLAACSAVPGRFERVEEGQPFLVLVDYAHTDDALRNAISAARELSPQRVITLFGCGGDRDRSKRPLMASAAAELSDHVVLTSDNPRSEDPMDIIIDALVGLRRHDTPHLVEPDREKAIRKAIELCQPGDILLIAGKGHETYQIVKEQVLPFDDREVARRVLRSFGYKRRPS